MNALCEVAQRSVMLGSAARGDHPSIIEFIVFAAPPEVPAPPEVSGPHEVSGPRIASVAFG